MSIAKEGIYSPLFFILLKGVDIAIFICYNVITEGELVSLRAHVFVDCENINTIVFKKAFLKLNAKYQIIKCDFYGKEEAMPKFYKSYMGKVFERHNCFFGKNSADTFMCIDMAKACYEEPLTDCYIIFSQDRDFSIAIKLLVDNNKKVIVVTKLNGLMSNLEAVGVDLNKIENIQINTKVNCTCFFKLGTTIKEVPFKNGIALQDFGTILAEHKIRKYYGKNKRLYKICEENLLKVVDGKVYFRKEDEYNE